MNVCVWGGKGVLRYEDYGRLLIESTAHSQGTQYPLKATSLTSLLNMGLGSVAQPLL